MNLTSSMEKCLNIGTPYVCALIMFLLCMTGSVLITCLCSCFCSANYKKMKNRARHRLLLAQDNDHRHHHHYHGDGGDLDDDDLLPFSLEYSSSRRHHNNRHAPASSQPSTLTLNSDSGRGSSSSGANYFVVSPSRLHSTAFLFGGLNSIGGDGGGGGGGSNSPSQFSQPPSPSLLSTDSGHVFGQFHRTFSTALPSSSINPGDTTVGQIMTQVNENDGGEQAPPPPYENFQPPSYAETISHHNHSDRKSLLSSTLSPQ